MKHYYKYFFILVLIAIYIGFKFINPFDNEIITEETENIYIKDVIEDYIFVDIKGEVLNPGVYKVNSDYRLFQVVELAGGFSENANVIYVNLSQKLTDEMVIYVPSVDDESTEIVDIITFNDKVSINNSTKEELDSLYGIGPEIAQNIIDYRNEFGSFKTIEDIMKVSGIGEVIFEKIKDDIIL